jgi:hypothetical protein
MSPSLAAGLILSKSEDNQMPKRIRTLTISRSKWGRNNSVGENSGGSLILARKDLTFTGARKEDIGKMCCLGFVCLAYGLSDKQIGPTKSGWGKGLPDSTSKSAQKKLPAWLLHSENDRDGRKTDIGLLANVNDNKLLSDKQKEGRIKRVFARHGIKVKFVK